MGQLARNGFLLALCIFVVNGQSEKLPKKSISILHTYLKSELSDKKIKDGIIDLISYNTWGLPIELQGHQHKLRFPLIADSLLTLNNDIICLQETFHPILREYLLPKLQTEYYTGSDYTCNQDIIPFISKDCFGGLMTLSRYPIVEEMFYKFPTTNQTSIIEKIGSKGFLFTTILFGDRLLNVVNTHLYAGDNEVAERMRKQQMIFLHSTLERLPAYHQNTTLFLGDFNIHHPSVAYSEVYDYLTDIMNVQDTKPNISPNDYTCDHLANKYVPSTEKRTKLDYIFIHEVENQTSNVLQSQRAMCSKKALSDHFAWSATIALPSKTRELVWQ